MAITRRQSRLYEERQAAIREAARQEAERNHSRDASDSESDAGPEESDSSSDEQANMAGDNHDDDVEMEDADDESDIASVDEVPEDVEMIDEVADETPATSSNDRKRARSQSEDSDDSEPPTKRLRQSRPDVPHASATQANISEQATAGEAVHTEPPQSPTGSDDDLSHEDTDRLIDRLRNFARFHQNASVGNGDDQLGRIGNEGRDSTEDEQRRATNSLGNPTASVARAADVAHLPTPAPAPTAPPSPAPPAALAPPAPLAPLAPLATPFPAPVAGAPAPAAPRAPRHPAAPALQLNDNDDDDDDEPLLHRLELFDTDRIDVGPRRFYDGALLGREDNMRAVVEIMFPHGPPLDDGDCACGLSIYDGCSCISSDGITITEVRGVETHHDGVYYHVAGFLDRRVGVEAAFVEAQIFDENMPWGLVREYWTTLAEPYYQGLQAAGGDGELVDWYADRLDSFRDMLAWENARCDLRHHQA